MSEKPKSKSKPKPKSEIPQISLGPDQWLSNIWLISNSGLCVFEQSYMKIQIDSPDQISGFILAMRDFAKAINSVEMKAMDFKGLKIYYRNSTKFFGVLATNDKPQIIESRKFLRFVTNEFEKQCGHLLIDDWDENTTIFDDFNGFIEEYVGKKSLHVKYFKNKISDINDAKIEK